MGLSNKLSCETESFSCCCNPHRFLQPEVMRLSFPALEPWVAWSVSLPSCSHLSACECVTAWSPSRRLAVCPLPGCLSPPLLLVWMDVSSLTPWLLDFHTVRFYSISDCFLFLTLLLSFFWLCKEGKYIYLCLHLGWNHLGLFLNIVSSNSLILFLTVSNLLLILRSVFFISDIYFLHF